jgi:hypothetical protein
VTALDDVVEAIRAADDDGWAVADAIARIPPRGESGYVTNEGIARYIATKHPTEYSPSYIGRMRQTADAFPVGNRFPTVPFTAHYILRRNPEKLVEWAKAHPNQPLSATEADKLRPKSAASTEKPDAWKQKVDRALGVIANLAENDPTWTIGVLEQAIATLEQQYPKAKRRDLRAV